MRKSLKLTAASLSALILLAGLLTLIAVGLANTDLARRAFLDRVNGALNGRITLADHRLALLGSRLELRELVLRTPDNTVVFALDRLLVDWRWRDLLSGTLHLSEVVLDTPDANLIIDADGRLNLLEIFPPGSAEEKPDSDAVAGSSELPINIVIADLHLQGGRLDLRHLPAGVHLRLADLGADADADLKRKRAHLRLRLAGLDIETSQVDTRIAVLDLETALHGDRLNLENLSIITDQEQTRLNAQGRVEGLGPEARLDFKLALEGELAQWASLLPPDRPLSGPLTVDLAISGLLNDPTTRLKATYGGGRLAGIAMRTATLDLGLEGRRLTLEGLKLQPAEGELELAGEVDLRPVWPEGFLKQPPRLDQLRYQLDLAAQQLPLSLVPQLPAGYGGRLGASMRLNGQGIAPHAPHAATSEADGQNATHADLSGSLTLSEGETPLAGTPATATLTTEIRLIGGRIEVDRIDLTAPEASLLAHGQVDLAGAQLSAEARLEADDLSRLATLSGLEHLTGQLAGQFSVAGQLTQPEIRFELDGRDLAVHKITIGDLALAGDLSPQGELALAHLHLVNQGSRVDAQGRLQLPMDSDAPAQLPIDMTLDLDTVRASDFVTTDLAQGQLDGKIVLGGSLSRPEAEATLRGQAIAVAGVTLGDLGLEARIAEGLAQIHQLALRNGESHLKIDGEVALYDPAALTPLEDPGFRLNIEAPVVEIADFYDQARGRLSLKGRLMGSRSAPTADLHLDGRDLMAAGQSATELGLDLSLAGQRLTVENLTLALADDARIGGDGWVVLAPAGGYELSLRSQAIPLARIAALQSQEAVTGVLSFDLAGSGKLDDPGLAGDIRLTEMRLNQKPIDDGHLRLTVADGVVRLAGGLNFDLEASYRWATQAFEAALAFDGTDLAPYLIALGQGDLAGHLNGRIQAQGELSQPKQIQADVDLTEIALTYKGHPLLATRSLKAQFAQQTLRLAPTRLHLLDEGILNASGEMSLAEIRQLRLNGQVPLAVANPFLGEGNDLGGRADLQLDLSGAWQDPRIDARVSLDRVAMTLPVTYQKLHRLSGQLRYDGQHLVIEEMTGQLDDGRFALGGRAEILGAKVQGADLSFEARALPLALPDTLDLKLDSDLRLVGSGEAASLEGEVILLEGLYYKDVKLNLLKAATTRRRAQAPPADREPSPLLEAVLLDVRVGHRRPLYVDNNLADLQLTPDLQVGGTLAQPVLSGRAQVTEGELTYQKKTFTINRGVIDFIDPYRIEPEVDVVSETQVRDWQITLGVSGTPDALLFKLSSDPAEEDNDILSLLLLGRTSRELIEGEGGSNQSTKQMMANLVASTMGEDIKRTTGVDIFEVDTANDEEDPESERIQVTVGKKLSRRMTLKYALESKAGIFTRRVISEYKFIDQLLATGFQDSAGGFGGELLFRLEFR